jgi:hypothetical protein
MILGQVADLHKAGKTVRLLLGNLTLQACLLPAKAAASAALLPGRPVRSGTQQKTTVSTKGNELQVVKLIVWQSSFSSIN